MYYSLDVIRWLSRILPDSMSVEDGDSLLASLFYVTSFLMAAIFERNIPPSSLDIYEWNCCYGLLIKLFKYIEIINN